MGSCYIEREREIQEINISCSDIDMGVSKNRGTPKSSI